MNTKTILAWIAVGVLGIPAAIGVLWVLDQAAGTGWALPVAAGVLLLAFLVDFGAGKATTR